MIFNVNIGAPGGPDGKESACSRRPGFDPWVRRSHIEGNGNPLQYSCLENLMDGGAWQATYSPWSHKESDMIE